MRLVFKLASWEFRNYFKMVSVTLITAINLKFSQFILFKLLVFFKEVDTVFIWNNKSYEKKANMLYANKLLPCLVPCI